MIAPIQPDLFERARDAGFDSWVHTPAGAEVANRFIRVSIAMKRSGFAKYGAKGIAERLRWHYSVVRRDAGFKINNNWVSRLARMAEQRAPELRGFFEMRKLREQRRGQ
jgi:hypothetical protein